jgi:hypothetical protein
MVVPRHRDVAAPSRDRLSDAGVIGRDGETGEIRALTAAVPDVLDERLARDEVERFAGESR